MTLVITPDTPEIPTLMAATAAKVDPDEAWVKLAQAGDLTGFRALYDKYFEPVYRFCYWQTLDSATAEDLTQVVFLAVHQQLPKFRSTAQFRNWLYAIAKNQIARWIRQKQRLPQAPLFDSLEAADTDDWLDSDQDSQAQILLPRLFEHLKPIEVGVLQSRYLKNLSVAETAKKLRLSESAVKVTTHRAIAKLRRFFPDFPQV